MRKPTTSEEATNQIASLRRLLHSITDPRQASYRKTVQKELQGLVAFRDELIEREATATVG